jgi:hypothetical protein
LVGYWTGFIYWSKNLNGEANPSSKADLFLLLRNELLFTPRFWLGFFV